MVWKWSINSDDSNHNYLILITKPMTPHQRKTSIYKTLRQKYFLKLYISVLHFLQVKTKNTNKLSESQITQVNDTLICLSFMLL